MHIKKITPIIQKVEVNWDIIMRCNYTCWYCNVYNNTPTPVIPIENYYKAIDYLKSLWPNLHLCVYLVGGEPTLYKNWYKILNYLIENNIETELVTNLSISKEKLEKIANNLIPDNICISASYHAAYQKPKSFLEKAKMLNEKGVLDTIYCMVDLQLLDKSLELHTLTRATSIKSKLVLLNNLHDSTLYGVNSLYEYPQEILDLVYQENRIIKKKPNIKVTYSNNSIEETTSSSIISKQLSNFKGMRCEIGQERLFIDYTGNCYPSACIKDEPKAKMGNVFEKNIKLFTNAITCPFSHCGCDPDIRISKYQ